MDARKESILEASIEDYIKTGEPITSERLYRFYDFGIKPAMIRWELNDLSEAGYLEQVHLSGGRLPTNKAYRFFVNNLLDDEDLGDREKNWDWLDDLMNDLWRGRTETFINGLAHRLHLLSIGYEPSAAHFWNSGLKDLLSNLESAVKSDLVQVVSDFESLPERFLEEKNWCEHEDSWPQFFIGQNPFTRSEHLSVLAHRFDFGPDKLILMTIGPKRMDYQKSLNVFKHLKKRLKK